ncbi:MAG: hypothetical protein ACKOZV_12295, partial [Bacteroidota bacterium]
MLSAKHLPETVEERQEALLRLAQSITQNPFRDDFIRAYITDTAFTWRDVVKREIETPAAM